MLARLFTIRRALAALTLILISLSAVRADDDQPAKLPTAAASNWIAIPSGVADPDSKTAFVTDVTDGVEAIDLQTGHALWQAKQAHRPLGLSNNHLVAIEPRGAQTSANTFNVCVLDADSGQSLVRSQPIVFPEWIAVDGGIGLGFTSTVSINDNTLTLHWHAWRQFVGGVPATTEAVEAAKKDETGIALVDLTTGHTSVDVDDIPKPAKRAAETRFTEVGNTRLEVTERQEKLPNGVQVIHRTLEATNKDTGRPLWHHEIASDLIVPDSITATARTQAVQQPAERR